MYYVAAAECIVSLVCNLIICLYCVSVMFIVILFYSTPMYCCKYIFYRNFNDFLIYYKNIEQEIQVCNHFVLDSALLRI